MKLSQALAKEQQEKGRYAEASKWFSEGVKSFIMDGFTRTYQPADEDGEQLAPEEKLIQHTWKNIIREMRRYTEGYVDAVATKDYANRTAVASVLVDGETLIADAPVPFLLFLEKHLGDWRNYVSRLPTRDRGQRWEPDGDGTWKTDPTFVNRSIKQKVPIVLYNATPEHPAQTQLIEKAVTVGRYTQINYSGQPSAEQKEDLIARLDKLISAVREARESANSTKIDAVSLAGNIFNFVFG